jgi:diaminohydroxyphosphoribosylaminopyrimidine deaminase/5-amino-6-(5-phosphoribosylamino)uracil reductase
MATQQDQDIYWMQRALELARRGIGISSPNPAVGCVILDCAGQVIGEGWHEYDLLDHAEVAALKVAQQHAAARLKGGTAYVTLEPCNHTGRTGPCTQALIAAGLKRVVAATGDPNPNVTGHGMDVLRAAGMETRLGVCEGEARRINEGFARWIQSKRPFVLMKVAMTLDGRIGPAPAVHQTGFTPGREPYWITSEASRQTVQLLRWQADAALTGVDTVLADDPQLTDRSGRRRRRPLLRVVLDSALRIPLDCKLVRTADFDVCVFTVSNDEKKIIDLTRRGVRVEVLPAEHGRVPLGAVLDKLGAEGILTVLTETGTRLNSALLAGGFVDRVHIFVSPQIMGSDAVPAFKAVANPIHMDAVEVERYGNDLGLCSLLRDPWVTGKSNSTS